MADPKTLPFLDPDEVERFWSKVAIGDPHECWLWQASTFKDGYGQFKAHGRNLKAHRLAYQLNSGRDPVDRLVCHTCDNPGCCNPAHLFEGTARDNANDCREKGRMKPCRGDDHFARRTPESVLRGEHVGGCKLTEAQVLAICERYKGGDSQIVLADEYGITRENVSRIIRGLSWTHLTQGKSLSQSHRRGSVGSKNPSAKLTVEQVREIRILASSGMTPLEIAERFSVKRETIYHLLNGRTWTHVV